MSYSRSDMLQKISSWVTIIAFPIVILGGVLAFFQLKDYFVLPNLTLQFGIHQNQNPESVDFLIVNNSQVTAQDPYYFFAISDLNGPTGNALPIPAEVTTFIKAGEAQGFNQLMEAYGKPGHIYAGRAMITCNNCKTTKNYFIYIDNQQPDQGFYFPLNDGVNIPLWQQYWETKNLNLFSPQQRIPFTKID